MRIALITDAWHPQVNGVVTTWTRVLELLELAGHETLAVHPTMSRTVAMPRYPEIRLSLSPGRVVRNALDRFRPDAIHIATEGPLGMAGRRYCRRRGLLFTTSYHTQFAMYARKYFGVPQRLTYALVRWFHGGAERTLVPTPSIERELTARGFRNLVVWTRGVETERFRPRPKSFLDLPRPILMYVGRVAREKNIGAFLALDLPGSKVVVGDGPELERLKRAHADVMFVGMKRGEELAQHYAAADVFVFPSVTDTFGVVMLEAMACGVPVAAYPVTGPIDVLENGISGVMHDDLTTAAWRALDLDPLACRRCAMKFSWDRCANVLLETLAPINGHCGAAEPSAALPARSADSNMPIAMNVAGPGCRATRDLSDARVPRASRFGLARAENCLSNRH